MQDLTPRHKGEIGIKVKSKGIRLHWSERHNHYTKMLKRFAIDILLSVKKQKKQKRHKENIFNIKENVVYWCLCERHLNGSLKIDQDFTFDS